MGMQGKCECGKTVEIADAVPIARLNEKNTQVATLEAELNKVRPLAASAKGLAAKANGWESDAESVEILEGRFNKAVTSGYSQDFGTWLADANGAAADKTAMRFRIAANATQTAATQTATQTAASNPATAANQTAAQTATAQAAAQTAATQTAATQTATQTAASNPPTNTATVVPPGTKLNAAQVTAMTRPLLDQRRTLCNQGKRESEEVKTIDAQIKKIHEDAATANAAGT